jgi:hypothetical protein
LLAGFGDDETELESDPDVFILRAVRGFEGDFFRGTPEVPFLLTANHKYDYLQICYLRPQKIFDDKIIY